MQKTYPWYEGIAIGIAFLVGIGLSAIPLLALFMSPINVRPLLALFMLPGNKLENFDLVTQLAIVVAGPLAYIISLWIYPRPSNDSMSMVVWQKCCHAVFFALAMMWIPFSLMSLGVILHPLLMHIPFPSFSLSTIVTIPPFWEPIISTIPLAVYFGILWYIEWRLHHNYVAIFTAAFGFFAVTANFRKEQMDIQERSRASQIEYVRTKSGKCIRRPRKNLAV